MASEKLAEQAHAAAAGSEGALARELSALAEASEEHLQALGGIWTPPPRPGTPSPTPTESVSTVSAQDVVGTLADMTTSAGEVIANPLWSNETATLLASIMTYRSGALLRLRELLGNDGDGNSESTKAAETSEPPGLTELSQRSGQDAAALCRTLDALGYGYEVRAARSDGQQQDRAATRARHYRATAEEVAEAAGIDGSEDDPRRTSYSIGDDLDQTIASWRAELVPGWLSLIGGAEPGSRAELFAHLQVAASHASLPAGKAFPGLDQP